MCAIFLLAFATAIAGSAEDYRAARAELVAAYQVEDYPAMRAAEAKPGANRGLSPQRTMVLTGASSVFD